jgi:NTE family protein
MASKTVSLVLGSGGARGLTHIGVIRCLEANGFRISYVSGTSIGALIGGIYAAGKLETYADWVCALNRRDVLRLLDWSFSRGSLFRGDRVIGVLEELIGEHRIEELAIGFTAIATDINRKREVWLNKGSLFEAIRASIAMPLVFAPVERNGVVLVDGGLVNPVPIAPTLNDDTELTIAVDLNGRAEQLDTKPATGDEPDESERSKGLRERIAGFIDKLTPTKSEPDPNAPNAVELALRSIDTMQTTIARMKVAAYSPDLMIEMPVNLCTFLEFHRGRELIDFGYRRTQASLRDIDDSEPL